MVVGDPRGDPTGFVATGAAIVVTDAEGVASNTAPGVVDAATGGGTTVVPFVDKRRTSGIVAAATGDARARSDNGAPLTSPTGVVTACVERIDDDGSADPGRAVVSGLVSVGGSAGGGASPTVGVVSARPGGGGGAPFGGWIDDSGRATPSATEGSAADDVWPSTDVVVVRTEELVSAD